MAHGSQGRQARTPRHKARRGPQVYWGLHVRTLTSSHDSARLLGTHKVASAHSWGPEAVGRGLLPYGPAPPRSLPPGQRKGGGCWGGPGQEGEASRRVQEAGPGPGGPGQEGPAALTPATGASATASAPSSGWSRGSRPPGTSRPRPCKPERGETPDESRARGLV